MTFDSSTGMISFTSSDIQTYNQPSYQIQLTGKLGSEEIEIPITMSINNPCESEHLYFDTPKVFDSRYMVYNLGGKELSFNWISDQSVLTDSNIDCGSVTYDITKDDMSPIEKGLFEF